VLCDTRASDSLCTLKPEVDKWESIAERKIREAFEAGAFDDLPCKGKPIPIDTNPYEDSSLWMAHHLLRVNGFAPPWIEEGREIDAELAGLRASLGEGSRRSVEEFRERGAELNRRILTYNLKSPSAHFHKRPLNVDAEIRAAQTHLPAFQTPPNVEF
jgi:DnaJ homolog subfamily C member 28